MAHFAQIDENSVVLRVDVVNNDVIDHLPFPDSEPVGVEFLVSLYGPSTWKQTSYNNNFRGVYAGVGFIYDPVKDIFFDPRPIPPLPNPAP